MGWKSARRTAQRRALLACMAFAFAPPDRAQVEKLIADLKATPVEVTIGAERLEETDLRALVLLDGVIVGGSPSTVKLPPGDHVFERIAPGHYALEQTIVGTDDARYYGLGWRSFDHQGNVVISINDRMQNETWTEHGVELRSNARFELPVGHYKTVGEHDHLCTPLVTGSTPGPRDRSRARPFAGGERTT